MDAVLTRVKEEGRTVLTELEAKDLLKQAGIKVNDTRLAATKAQAVALAREMGFPVVLKIASPDVIHKSDAGGVKVGLRSQRQVGQAYQEIMASVRAKHPQARLQGVTVQAMARPGVEVIIGVSQDPQFGPVLMFGLGGIWVEVLKDVAFRLIPITPYDAREMIREIKGFPLLEGYRGQEPAHLPTLEGILLQVSELVEKHPQVQELDINPIFAYRDGAVAVDARVILAK